MTDTQKSGLLIAAPASGSGKTVITLALLRAMKMTGYAIVGAKAGPDYIDPGFHALACNAPSVNLDPWAMDGAMEADRLKSLAASQPGSHLLVEGMMGLFDGAADGSGSAASLAKILNIPVVLVVDAAKQSHSIAAMVRGFRDHDRAVHIAGVILNRVGSARHEKMLRQAINAIGVQVLGAVPRDEQLALPERHLGLVQAGETSGIETFIDQAAEIVNNACDLDAIAGSFSPIQAPDDSATRLPPLGQHIAIAQDEAFSFAYPHMLNDWQAQGAELSFFSPLGDETRDKNADAIFLPGGYPELHGGRIAAAENFKSGLKAAADEGTLIYGECGGYMVLGDGLVDRRGQRHAMAGLLRLETSFEKRKLHLGYRNITARDFPLGDTLKGHEFHYSTIVHQQGEPLFDASDALGDPLGPVGLRTGNVMGSYMHVIDRGES